MQDDGKVMVTVKALPLYTVEIDDEDQFKQCYYQNRDIDAESVEQLDKILSRTLAESCADEEAGDRHSHYKKKIISRSTSSD